MTPSADPGKRLAECTGMNGCSAHQNDSKPSSSAFVAMKPTSTRYAGSGTEMPTFIRGLPLPTGRVDCLGASAGASPRITQSGMARASAYSVWVRRPRRSFEVDLDAIWQYSHCHIAGGDGHGHSHEDRGGSGR